MRADSGEWALMTSRLLGATKKAAMRDSIHMEGVAICRVNHFCHSVMEACVGDVVADQSETTCYSSYVRVNWQNRPAKRKH